MISPGCGGRTSAMRRLLVLLLIASALPAAHAQRQYADPYPVESLAQIMGELHYLAFACQGRDSQDWREAMLELLQHEAPTRGAYRQRLVERFNTGFRNQERQRTRCGAEAELERQRLAATGQALSERLRRTYLD